MFSKSLVASLVLLVFSSSAIAAPSFGSCSVPRIQFAAGLDGRKETSFKAVDQSTSLFLSYDAPEGSTHHTICSIESFNHGSTDDIDNTANCICQQLQTSCKANSDAVNLCKSAVSAADKAAEGSGAQADAFNSVFGIKTNFASVTQLNANGQAVNNGGSASQDPQSALSK